MDIGQYRKSRAVVIERPYQAALREIGLTEPGEDAYVARTLVSAISSGTDMKTYKGMQHPEQCYYPLVPGYETAGVVEAVGEKADGRLKAGDRVMINECRRFADVCSAWGGGSEYTVKDRNTTNDQFDYMVKLPDNVSFEEGSLAYLPCVALKGIRRLSLEPGQVIAVPGAGMVGISALQILKILCPEVVTLSIDPSAHRRGIAKQFADFVASPEEAESVLRKITDGKMADAVMECSGNPAVVGTLHRLIKDGGWGHDDPPAHIHLQGDYPDRILMDHYHRWFVKNCTITMTCALMAGCKEQVLEWISQGRLNVKSLPVEVWPVSKCAEAFAYQAEKGEDVFKILFDWSK